MKIRDFVRLEQHLMPELSPAFQIQGRLSFVVPVSGVLRGFYFEPSAFNITSFYVNAFFMPLCVPATRIHLTFGHRIGDNKRWDIHENDFIAKLGRALRDEKDDLFRLQNPEIAADALRSMAKLGNPHSAEAYAYMLVIAGKIADAFSVTDDLLRSCNPKSAWQKPIIARVAALRAKLSRSLVEAQDQLAEWEAISTSNLKLPNSAEFIRTNHDGTGSKQGL